MMASRNPVPSIKPNSAGEYVRPQFTEENSVLAEYCCEMCAQILLDPVETSCGRIICRKCILSQFSPHDEKIACPFEHDDDDWHGRDCYTGLTRDQITTHYATWLNMSNLFIFCSNHNMGCMESMKWKKLENHMTSCEYTPVLCANALRGCQQMMGEQQDSVNAHLATCGFTEVKCTYCRTVYLRMDEENHFEECQSVPKNCGLCNEMFSSWLQLQIHQKLNCFHGERPCYYCGGVKLSPSEMKTHLDQYVHHHFELLTIKLVELSKDIIRSQKKVTEYRDIELSNETDNKILQNKMGQMLSTTMELHKQVPDYHGDGDKHGHVEELKTKIQALANAMAQVPNEIFAVKKQLSSVEYLDEQISNTRKLCAKLPRYEPVQGTGYNGVLHWKITNVDAKLCSDHNELSPSFYTQPGGYCFAGGVYFDGVDDHKGTHLSIAIGRVDGDFDEILPMTMMGNFTFTLMFPGDRQQDVYQEIKNKAVKIPYCVCAFDIVTLEQVPTFVKNNALYVKLEVSEC